MFQPGAWPPGSASARPGARELEAEQALVVRQVAVRRHHVAHMFQLAAIVVGQVDGGEASLAAKCRAMRSASSAAVDGEADEDGRARRSSLSGS